MVVIFMTYNYQSILLYNQTVQYNYQSILLYPSSGQGLLNNQAALNAYGFDKYYIQQQLPPGGSED